MRIIGHRKERPIAFSASADLLAEGARFNDEIHRLPTGSRTFFPKGVYRYRTHAEANQHQEKCLTTGMAQVVLERSRWDKDVSDRIVLERALEILRGHAEKPSPGESNR